MQLIITGNMYLKGIVKKKKKKRFQIQKQIKSKVLNFISLTILMTGTFNSSSLTSLFLSVDTKTAAMQTNT